MNKISFISLQEALAIHDILIETYGGSSGTRDKKLLESALGQAQITVFGAYACQNVFEMAACYCYHIIKNHAFVDGNKRTGILIMLTFLEKNGYTIKPKTDLYALALGIAASKISKEKIVKFLKANTVQIER